ncbi:MAG: hypothetical protein BECKG1743D_GA0114223_106671 [Candidatus Kentron sp. G]|nr:MAG: hypothetical protein BECKG1743E_GA0114224_102474 [Candidatus Kentron sp. G]VFN01903.1 MAG: hypothetical protein BECKG1743F_GA0114225_106311 [Candidatus Kentron sp. G]VFN05061.1 MAG: hypothetical protein BECKG1743D_GA0114223_106671 [Candidatus Kentron sp. G]
MRLLLRLESEQNDRAIRYILFCQSPKALHAKVIQRPRTLSEMLKRIFRINRMWTRSVGFQ